MYNDRSNEQLCRKCPALVNRSGVILQHDCTSTRFKINLRQLEWEVISNPPYSPGLAPSDFYLLIARIFYSGQNFQKQRGS